MKTIKIIIYALTLVLLALLIFGTPIQTQAAPSTVEPAQFSCANVTEIPQSECEALVAIYNVFIPRPSSWLATTTPCSWSDISCENGHVIRFLPYYSDVRLSSLPAEIGNLTNLTTLHLSYNQLSSLPAEIGNITNLTSLNLSGNQLSSLPAEIGNLTNLTSLNLSGNQLSSLPAEIGNLTNLTSLDLSGNQLSSLPAEIGNLTNLTTLHLSYNQLNSLPAEIGNLTNLTSLNLRNNQLLSLPASFMQLVSLYELDVSNNYLLEIGADLRTFINQKDPDWAVTQFDANICNYVTEIPQSECEALVAIYNVFTSRPSSWLATNMPCNRWDYITCESGHVTKLSISYSYDQLSSLPAEIGNLTNLTSLNLSYNQLSNLPAEIGNLTNLTELYLDSNQLSNLPADISNLANLTTLSLDSNKLSSLPAEIGNLTNLTTLDLSHNKLSSLSAEVGNLINLTMLDLDFNQLNSLPAEIGNLAKLYRFSLAYNRLVIPDDLHSFITGHDADWLDTQTVAPISVEATVLDSNSIELTWIPIIFNGMGGYYEISVSEGDTFTVYDITINKRNSRYIIDGLTSGTTYNIRIRTYTPAHYNQPSEIWSEYSPVVSAMTLVPQNTPTLMEEDREPLGNKLFLPLISN